MVRPRSCPVIYYFDTLVLRRRHQSFGTAMYGLNLNDVRKQVCQFPRRCASSKKKLQIF